MAFRWSVSPGRDAQNSYPMTIRTGLLNAERDLRFPQLAVALAIVLSIFTLVFGIWTATSAWSFPRFVVAVVVLIHFPGKLLLDVARLRLRPLEDLTLSLVLGMSVSSFIYWMCAFLSVPYAFLMWPLVSATVWFYRRRKRWHEVWRFHLSLNSSHILLLGVIILGLIPLAALPMYYRNMRLLPHGDMTFLSRPNDVIFHLAIANELTHSIPPQTPFLAGQSLGYHYAMDLLVAMFSNSAWLSVLDLTTRFVPTFFLIVTVLATFCFSRIWLHSGYGAVLSTFLVVFGEDLSFVPGLLLGSQEIWSAQFFGMPTTYSLYSVNPMLPALGILFSGLFCLVQFCRGEGRFWLILTGFLFAILMEYKVFATAHVLIGLAIAGIIYLCLFRDTRLLKALALTTLLAGPLVLYSLFCTEAGARVWTRIYPWPYVSEALEGLGLLNTSLGEHVNALFGGGPVAFAGLAGLFLVALPGYLLGSLGLRVMGVPRMLKELFRPNPSTVVRFFVGVLIILGPLITLTLTVTPWSYPPDSEYNDAVWFYVQSKYVVWVFVVELIVVLCRGKRRFWQALVVSMVMGLSIPSTIQYFDRQMSYKLDILDASQLEVMDFLRQSCLHGEVVLSRQRVAEPIVAVTDCRVPVLDLGTYTHSFVSMAELTQRRRDRDDFWDGWGTEELQTGILERYDVMYLVIDKRAGDTVRTYGSGTEGHGRSALKGVSLQPCFENEDFMVYKVWQSDEEAT